MTATAFPLPLADLGQRICILGPSNSGKSTLAAAIARQTGLPPVHLDQLHHLPHTNWQPRPAAEFLALHEAAIAGDSWVMDGNYSRCLPQRLRRATGLLVLDVSTATSLLRYVRRTLLEHDRPGSLAGGPERINWEMLHHIAVATPGNRRRYARLLAESPLPKLFLNSARLLNQCYQAWGLTR